MADYIPVLTFHAIEDMNSVISFKPELFERFMYRLWRNGYRTLSLSDAAGLVHDRKPFPDRSFVLTFDDGYRSVYDEAFPVLCKYKFAATVFLIAGGRKNYPPHGRLAPYSDRETLGWGEIREMSGAGIDFGAHTVTHPGLTAIDTTRVEYEMLESKEVIEHNLGAPVLSFAYPFGLYDDRCVEIAKRYFSCACSDELGLLTGDSTLFAIKRVDAYYLRRERLLGLIFTKSFPLYLFLRNVPRKIARRLGGR